MHGFADYVIDRCKAFVVEIVVQPVDHVLDDAVTVMHYRCTHLHISRTEQHKFDRVAPCVDTADARDRNVKFGIAGKLRNHIQSDRLYRRSAITAMGRHAVHIWIRDHRIDIDAHHRVDRIYQRNRIRSTALGSLSGRDDMSNIRGEFYDDGKFRNFLDPLRNHASVLRNLPHRGPHSALTHTMRTAKVKFKTIATGILRALRYLLPSFLF